MERLHDLLIIDDVFPSELSPFRREELSEMLTNIKDTAVLATGKSLALLNSDEDIQDVICRYCGDYEEFADCISVWDPQDGLENVQCKLAYTVFLNNIYNIVDMLEHKGIPFVFELYPGGGFALNNPESDEKLERVLRSPCFRKVIVTQDITHEYLLEKGWCGENEIIDIFGVVIPNEILSNSMLTERFMEPEKLVLSFCAYKYSPKGFDKGYDIFIDTAKKLHAQFPAFRFQVIGNFEPADIDVEELGTSIEFLGVLTREELSNVFAKTDILVAPNRAGVLEDGFFDGFPTTSCITAALNGALIMTTDVLSLNGGRFTSGTDIEILPPDAEMFFQRIVRYQNNRKQFMEIRRRQMERVLSLYGKERQITPRINALQQEIGRCKLSEQSMEEYPRAERITIPVMHCFDNNYVIPAASSFYSMLKNASEQYDYKLYVLHTDITAQNQKLLQEVVSKFRNASLEFINMENRFEDIWEKLTFSGHFSKEVLYKLLVPSIFPQYEKIIITDVDVVFCGDISSSYFAMEPEEPVCFAGVRHICPKGTWLDSYYDNYLRHFGKNGRDELKVCGGYLVANLHYMRTQKKEKQFLAYLSDNAYRLLQSEQDVINFCCKESEIKYLPLNNVVCSYMYDIFTSDNDWAKDPFYSEIEIQDAMERPIQLHYATGIKPWKDPLSTKADVWVRYLAESGMYPAFMKKQTAAQQNSPVSVEKQTVGAGWRQNESPMTVSVLCCTYNHEKFIRETLDGIVNQEVDFPFEIIVADDASTDSTQAIIREYAEKYRSLFKCILRQKNVGIGENYYDALQHVSGRFLAICDGDDQWIGPHKLQKQVDYLNRHPACNICCTSFTRREHDGDAYTDSTFSVNDYVAGICGVKKAYSFHDLLYCRFIASCTTMLRWQFLDRVPEFLRHYRTIDFPLCLLHAASGSIGVLNDEISAVYNTHAQGITSASNYNMQQESKLILVEIDQYLDYRFTQAISDFIAYAQGGRRGGLQAAQVAVQQAPGELSGAVRSHCTVKKHMSQAKWKLYAFFREIYLEYLPEPVHTAWRNFKAKRKK